jgi:dCTP deaminase
LVFSVYNAGPAPVHLRDQLPLFLIWFADLDRTSQKIRKGESEKTLSNDLLKGMSGEILSLQSLSEQIASIKFETRLQSWFVGIAGSVFLAVVIALAVYVVEHGLGALAEDRHRPQPTATSSPSEAPYATVHSKTSP